MDVEAVISLTVDQTNSSRHAAEAVLEKYPNVGYTLADWTLVLLGEDTEVDSVINALTSLNIVVKYRRM